MSNLKISIITPTLNQGAFIEQTIDSILSQGYPNLEYIIMDGGSTDNTIEVIRKYAKHISYWESKPDQGQTHAINKGLNRSSGDIVNWLNSDDYYTPGTLKSINAIFQDEHISAALGKSRLFDSETNFSQVSKGGHLYPEIEKTIGDALIDQPSAFFRAEVFRGLGPLDENLRYLMDRSFWIKYLIRYGQSGVKKVDSVFTNFRLHAASKTISETIGFNKERNGIYHSLSKHYLGDEFNEQLAQLSQVDEIEIHWDTLAENKVNIAHVMHEFYAVLFKEAYADGNFKHALDLNKIIIPTCLTAITNQGLNKLSKRLNVFPNWFLRCVQQIRK